MRLGDKNPFVFFFVCMLIVFALLAVKTYLEKTKYPFENVNTDYMIDERVPQR